MSILIDTNILTRTADTTSAHLAAAVQSVRRHRPCRDSQRAKLKA